MTNKQVANKEKTEGKDNPKEQQLSNFTQELQEELGKIVWPSRQQLLSESIAVILMVTLVATIIYLSDNFFAWIAGRVF